MTFPFLKKASSLKVKSFFPGYFVHLKPTVSFVLKMAEAIYLSLTDMYSTKQSNKQNNVGDAVQHLDAMKRFSL